MFPVPSFSSHISDARGGGRRGRRGGSGGHGVHLQLCLGQVGCVPAGWGSLSPVHAAAISGVALDSEEQAPDIGGYLGGAIGASGAVPRRADIQRYLGDSRGMDAPTGSPHPRLDPGLEPGLEPGLKPQLDPRLER